MKTRKTKRPKHSVRENVGAAVAFTLSTLAMGGVLAYHRFVDALRFPFLVSAAAFAAVFLVCVMVAVVMSDSRLRPLPVPQSDESLHDLDDLPQPVAEPTPHELDLRTTAAILRFFGVTTAVVCVPAAMIAAYRWYPGNELLLLVVVASLTALQSWACFRVAAKLAAPTSATYLGATCLLCLELAAFPLTLMALMGLFYLYRGKMRASLAPAPG